MGFITPGIHYVFDKKRKGRNNKFYNNNIHANESHDFIRRYPKNLYLREISDIRRLYTEIKDDLRRGDKKFKNGLSLLRSKIEKYILLLHELENLLNVKTEFPLSKNKAIELLKKIINIQGRMILENIQSNITSLPLEASLDKQFNLIDGGCILFNKFLNNELTVDLRKNKFYSINKENQKVFYRSEADVQKNILSHMFKGKEIKIIDLPDEILVKILSLSNNISNISLSCKFFNKFVLQHMEFISYEFIISKYVHKYKLKFSSQPNNMTDENHHQNSLTIKLSDNENNLKFKINDFKEDIHGKFSLTRYKDPDFLNVISSHAFETPYMTYQIYQSLNIDHVMPPSAWLDLEERYNSELNELKEEVNTKKIDKEKFKEFWNEYTIKVPYLDENNPSNINYIKNGAYVDKLRIIIDLMISKTRFSNNIEDLFYFLVSLVIGIEHDKIVESSESILPINLLKSYAIFYRKQQILESQNVIEGILDDDNKIWESISFSNPLFYILLKQSADEEIEEFLCPLFYGTHLKENSNFWMTLKNKREIELIEELINEKDTSPSTYILNSLAF